MKRKLLILLSVLASILIIGRITGMLSYYNVPSTSNEPNIIEKALRNAEICQFEKKIPIFIFPIIKSCMFILLRVSCCVSNF